MNLANEEVMDKLEQKIDQQSEQIGKVNNTLREVVDKDKTPICKKYLI